MIKKIEIDNYKGIKNFKLDKLNRINIFIGNNNSGKTSLLEAIYIGMKDNYMGCIEVIQNRNLNPSAKIMETLFNGMGTDNKITIKVEDQVGKVSTVITLLTDENKFTLPNNFPISASIQNQEEKKFLIKQKINNNVTDMVYKFGFVDKGNGQRDSIISMDINNPKKKGIVNPKNENIYYMSPKSLMNGNFIIELKEQIKSKNEKKKIIEELQLFDSKIEDIIVDGLNIEIYLKGIDKPLPIQAMGAGSSTILEMASIFGKDKVHSIFIDEIEDGLHIKSMESVAKYISRSMEKNPKLQLFITTHSKEIIKLITTSQINRKSVSAYRLYIKNDQTKTVEYTDDLLESIEEGWEIR